MSKLQPVLTTHPYKNRFHNHIKNPDLKLCSLIILFYFLYFYATNILSFNYAGVFLETNIDEDFYKILRENLN